MGLVFAKALSSSSGGTSVLAPPRKRRERGRDGPMPPIDGDDGGRGGDDSPPAEDGREPDPGVSRFALLLLMIGIGILFAVFLATWILLRRDEPDPTRSSPLVPPRALWLGTLVLVLSSLTLERSVRTKAPRAWLAASLVLGLLFLISQGRLWWTLVHAGLVPASGAWGAIFFALTGLHGLHVAGGLVAMAATLRRSKRATRESRRLCATYWHFMGVLWIAIFLALTFLL